MRVLLLSTAVLAWLAACGPRDRNRAARDTTNETGMAGDTMNMAPGATPRTDTGGMGGPSADTMGAAAILTTLSTANQQEIQDAKYARRYASSAAVRSLARRLETDHTANLAKGHQLAKQLGVSQHLPGDSGPEAPTNAVPPELSGKHGASFDRAFVQHQIEAHQTNIDRIRNQMIPSAKEPELRQYLQETVTAMEGHLAQARKVEAQLGGDSVKAPGGVDSGPNADSMVAPTNP